MSAEQLQIIVDKLQTEVLELKKMLLDQASNPDAHKFSMEELGLTETSTQNQMKSTIMTNLKSSEFEPGSAYKDL